MNSDIIIMLSPIVSGLVEGAKRAGLPTQYAGPAALVFAFACTALVIDDPTSREAAMTAVALGLTAAGLYSQANYYIEQWKSEALPPETNEPQA